MTERSPEYPDYRWRKKWCLGRWYVRLLLIACILVGTVAWLLFLTGELDRRPLIGMSLIPGFLLFWAGGFASLNSTRMWLDRRLGPKDKIAWPESEPDRMFWTQGWKGSFLFNFQFIACVYVYSTGFGWTGDSLQRTFVPWTDVLGFDGGWLGNRVRYQRNGTVHVFRAARLGILEAAMIKYIGTS